MCQITCLACLCAFPSSHAFASYVASFFTCLAWLHYWRVLRALSFLRALGALTFFTWLKWFHFVRVSRALILLCALRALIFYVPSFLRTFILFVHMLIKLTQINELIYRCLHLLLLNSVIYQRLLSIFTSVKLVTYSAWLCIILKRKY